MDNLDNKRSIEIAIAWCLAWGNGLEPQVDPQVLEQMRNAMVGDGQIPDVVQPFVNQAQALQTIPNDYFPENLAQLRADHPSLWNEETRIGLVYGGATKIKQYVFESDKLQDIRGASAILDRINLVDLPAFFHGEKLERFEQCQRFRRYCQQVRADWLDLEQNFPQLSQALIPELIIYSTGGNILAFCPSAYVEILADAIEKRYTQETLTANSCAVGDTFRLLELRFGLLKERIEETNWLDWYQRNQDNSIVEAYFGTKGTAAERFRNRKSFNELATKLAIRFNQRRSGQESLNSKRSTTRRYPPMFETHPYVRRDDTERRSAVRQVKDEQGRKGLPGEPWFSDTLARKRISGQKSKRDNQNTAWFQQANWFNDWQPGNLESWVNRFDEFLENHPDLAAKYNPDNRQLLDNYKEARSLREVGNASKNEVGNASKNFVAYIYADGNNMGGYIQNEIHTAEQCQEFSQWVSKATEECVYEALAEHLQPHQLSGIDDGEMVGRDNQWIHPFEILTIGGDDVFLVVPANQALAISRTLCDKFEAILLREYPQARLSKRQTQRPQKDVHRYRKDHAPLADSQLSMSAGVLITAQDTPIYYARNLVDQLLKSAKKYSKQLQPEPPKSGQTDPDSFYPGGTIDFLVMKSVTMLSSKVGEFRESGLVIDGKPKLKLYGAPYTLHEIGGLIDTARALKSADFPRSQLYQIRSLLERGKNTAMLNYRYFRVRLGKDKQHLLEEAFENAWCQPKDSQNGGNLAPWMSLKEDSGTTYETIWRELVDLYPFIDEQESTSAMSTQASREER